MRLDNCEYCLRSQSSLLVTPPRNHFLASRYVGSPLNMTAHYHQTRGSSLRWRIGGPFSSREWLQRPGIRWVACNLNNVEGSHAENYSCVSRARSHGLWRRRWQSCSSFFRAYPVVTHTHYI